LTSFPSRAFGSQALCSLAFSVKPMWSLDYMGNTLKTGKVFESAQVLDEDEERKCNLSRNF